MAYVDALLATGEQIVRRERQHWFVLVSAARWGILGITLGIALGTLRLAGSLPAGALGDALGIVTLLLLAGGALRILWSYLVWYNHEFVVTTRRVIVTDGVVNRRATDSSLEKINDAVLSQSLVGRVFGFGDLDVLTASEAGIERLRMLADATGFKRAMLDAKHALERDLARPAETGESAPAGTGTGVTRATTVDEVMATLARLAELRDRGAISSTEYEAKKEELLGRL